jgi:hypothetical protein
MGQPSWDDIVKIVRANPTGNLMPLQQSKIPAVFAPSAPAQASLSARVLSAGAVGLCIATMPLLPKSSSLLPLRAAQLQPGLVLSPSSLPRAPLVSALPLQPTAVATGVSALHNPFTNQQLEDKLQIPWGVVQDIGHGAAIPAAVRVGNPSRSRGNAF